MYTSINKDRDEGQAYVVQWAKHGNSKQITEINPILKGTTKHEEERNEP